MSKGGFIDHSFYFVGDGRTAGTGTLGTEKELAVKITVNIAAQLCEAGWTVDTINSFNQGTSIATATTYSITIGSNTYNIRALINDTYSIVECPLKYTDTGSRVSVLYSWSAKGFSEKDNNQLTNYFGSLATYDPRWCDKDSFDCCCGASLLYKPNDSDALKLVNVQGYTGSSTCSRSLSYGNTSGVYYNYHIITKSDYICMALHASNWTSTSNNQLKVSCVGNLISTPVAAGDTFTYGAFSSFCQTAVASGAEQACMSDQYVSQLKVDLGNYSTCKIPWIQCQDIEGHTLTFCNQYTNEHGNVDHFGVFNWNEGGLQAYSGGTLSSSYYSTIIVGSNIYRGNSSYLKQYVDAQNNIGIKGTINSDIMIKIGMTYQDNLYTWYAIGRTFDGGNYVNIGCGILMGWDSSNNNILNNSANEMAAISESQS